MIQTRTISHFAIDRPVIAYPALTDKPASYYNARMNVIRFIAMGSVVWGHCLLGLEQVVFDKTTYKILQAIMIQGGRVGTVMFFIISGFLLADKIDRFTPVSYLRHRFYPVILPWFIFLLLLVVIQLFNAVSLTQIFTGGLLPILKLLLKLIKGSVFHAAYWFVPVAIVSSVLLIALKKYVNRLWLGVVLAGISLLHGVNLYFGWLPVVHTMAIFGYVFYLWLGLFVKLHLNRVLMSLANIPSIILLFALTIVFWLACAEGINLVHIGCADAYASLRLSNAELSILIFMLLLKSHRLGFIEQLQPQKNTYGIYLIHSLVIIQLMPFVNKLIAVNITSLSIPQLILVQTAFFISAFGLTFYIVEVIKRSLLRPAIGLPNSNR